MSAAAGKTPSSIGALFLTVASLGFAVATGWLIWRLFALGGPGADAFRGVAVAARSIEAGRPLEAADLRVAFWPVAALPEGSYASIESLLSPPSVLTSGALPGEPILRGRVAGASGGMYLGALVRTEARAAAIRVERDIAQTRFVYPGVHVDVLATVEDTTRHRFGTTTLLQDVPVLAVGRHADLDAFRRAQGARPALGGSDDSDGLVFVEVSPRDSERLAVAARTGKIDLVVRNAGDAGRPSSAGASSNELARALDDPPAEASPAPTHRRASRSAAPIRVYHAQPVQK